MSIDYRTWYENAKAELARVRQEKAGLERSLADREKQIAALLQTLSAIGPLVGETTPDSEAPATGMTDSIRSILAQAGTPLSAAEIRERLEAMGFDMASYSNPLATIHTILRRLRDSAEADVQSEVEPVAGKRFVIGKDLKGFIGIARVKRRYANAK